MMGSRVIAGLALVLVGTGCLAPVSGAQLQPKERAAVDSALLIAGVPEAQLGYLRRRCQPSTVLLANLAVDKPIEGLEALMAVHAKSDQPLSTLLRTLCEDGFGEQLAPSVKDTISPSDLKTDLPVELQKPVLDLIEAVATSNASVRQALSGLSAEEKRQLIETLPQLASMGAPSTFEFVKMPKLSIEDFKAKLAKVNLKLIRSASVILADRVAQIAPKIRAVRDSVKAFGTIIFTIKGVTVELSDGADDVHDKKNTQLCVDLGGQNRYTGRYGAGIGYTGVLLDFGNGSSAAGTDATIGVGILGIGIAEFEGRGVVLRGKNLCFGVGLAGVGALSTAHATQIEARSISEGVGFEGIGLCQLSPEDDRVSVGCIGQGAGLPGGIGWLVNPAGNDTYISGGPLNDPRVPKGHYVMAQGYGGGIETIDGGLPGGVGLLTDREGNDIYTAGTAAQGFGEWGGVGSLQDGSGDDSYLAQGFAQGCGQNTGAGFFSDLEGNDLYNCRYAMGQGMANQDSVAILMDRGGEDLYSGRDVITPSARTGSFAMLLSASRIERRSGQVKGDVLEPSSVSLEIHLGNQATGPDRILTGTASSLARSGRVLYAPEGLGEIESKPGAQGTDLPKVGSITATGDEIDALFEKATSRYSLDSGAAGRKLVGIGLPAFVRILANMLTDLDTHGAEVLALIGDEVGPTAWAELAKGFGSAKADRQRALLKIAELGESKVLLPALKSLVDNPSLSVAICEYVTGVKGTESVPDLAFLALSESPSTRRAASEMICTLATRNDIQTLKGLIKSDDYGVRVLAIEALAKFSEDAVVLAKTLLQSGQESENLLGIRLLSAVGTEDAVRLAGSGLNAASVNLKLAALRAVNGRVPAAYRGRVLEMQRDSDAVVSLVARSTVLGRG